MPNNTIIGDLAEADFVAGLRKRGWNVYLEIKNGSQNGIDVIAQHPLTQKVHAFEVKANSSRMSVLQKGNDYIQNILDEIRTDNKLRGKTISDDVIEAAEIIDRDIKTYGLEGREVRYNVDKTSGNVELKKIKNWQQTYK